MLKQFTVGNCNYGFIQGDAGDIIITENDFVHALYEPGDKIELMVDFQKREYRLCTESEINALLIPIPSLVEWGAYFGIKTRVGHNYHLLLRSMKDIGIDVSDMPSWKSI